MSLYREVKVFNADALPKYIRAELASEIGNESLMWYQVGNFTSEAKWCEDAKLIKQMQKLDKWFVKNGTEYSEYIIINFN